MAEAFTNNRSSGRGERAVNRLLFWVVAVLAVLACGELAFHLLLAPRLLLRNVVLASDLRLAKSEILRAAGLEQSVAYFRVDAQEVRRRLEAIPGVEKASVQKLFPDTLRVTLLARRPLAALLAHDREGHALPLAVDRLGVVFQIGPELSEWDLPLLSGVEFAELRVGLQLPASLKPALEDLERLRAKAPELARLISEIRVIPAREERFELLVYPVAYPVRLRVGERLSETALRSALMVLDLLESQKLTGRVQELDMRTGEVVYRLKEG